MQATQVKRRWMSNMIEAAKADTPAMPWERGARRRAFIAKRKLLEAQAA